MSRSFWKHSKPNASFPQTKEIISGHVEGGSCCITLCVLLSDVELHFDETDGINLHLVPESMSLVGREVKD